MLAWRKNLAFIHLVPSAAAGVDMAKPPHEGATSCAFPDCAVNCSRHSRRAAFSFLRCARAT